jgi:3-hydroxymyristoyl/3-hydroxydecanoyl-(acyl carrier protein) dehydratase
MDGHFRAFSFVDRIEAVEPGVRIRGRYQIPPGIPEFPGSLVAEAVGQLAAWSAMAALDFKVRPVAGLAGRIELHSDVRPGQELELAAEIETAEMDAVAYGGTACADGKPVATLEHCVGPMMPLEEFDDPAAVRERFHFLCKTGATPGGFAGVPAFALEPGDAEPGRAKRATLRVPAEAPFFADHFPRRPVFPGTLLMHANLRLAAALAAEIPAPAGVRWRMASVSDVKLRAFTPPGEVLGLEAKPADAAVEALEIVVETRNGKRLVAGGRVQFAREGKP